MIDNLSQFILNHWVLWIALVGVLLVIFIYEQYEQKARPKAVSPEALVLMMNRDEVTVIDIRPEAAYRDGHIIQAIHAPVGEFTQNKKMNTYKNKPLVLVCTKGITAQTLATQLKPLGFEHVTVLSGGISAWQQANLPLVKGK